MDYMGRNIKKFMGGGKGATSDCNFSASTPNLKTEAAKKVAKLFPELVVDGQIDVDALEELLSPDLKDENASERYEFTWRGKKNAKRIADAPTRDTTLIADKKGSKDWDNTKNIFIEGDNLEVLKLMQKAYSEKIKMIYIDPPYNTGSDFIYKDNFHKSYKNYLKETGQIDKQGNSTTTNKKTSGRYHTKWLNMIYPRLKLARHLLNDDGVIFVSIDDNEIANLRYIMDELFGSNNFEGHIHWRRRKNQPNDRNKMIGLVAEHILVYAKNSQAYKDSGVGKIPLTGKFSNPDNDPNGPWNSKPWKVGSTQGGSQYEIEYPGGRKVNGTWMGSKDSYQKLLKQGIIYFPKNGKGEPRKKIYLKDRKKEGQSANNWWNFDLVGSNEEASSYLSNTFFNGKKVFSNPKPTKLIELMISLANLNDGDIVLDFFAGSATTGEAVVRSNLKDGSKVHYILVQLPDNLDNDLQTASDSKSRIYLKNAINELDKLNKPHFLTEIGKYRLNMLEKVLKKENDASNINYIDKGYRVFRLAKSTIKQWDENPANFEKQLELLRSPFTQESTNAQRALEIAIKSGINLDVTPEIDGDNYHFTTDDKEVFVILGNYDEALLDKLNEKRKLQNATVVLREMSNGSGSEVKFNLLEKMKQDIELNNHFSLEWL
ncbi:site-specific DNA-methyltransferase [Limosilactobacillus balticus]|uniref:site-specific DNA-methyltransferase n=1 Tax=Limosilactobacillus balticus TaxID=2759747 RepID=UPI003992E9A2